MSLTQVLIFFSASVLFVNADWKHYNINSGAPKDGISAGLNEFNKESYVGRGTYNGQLAPGKLMVEASHYSAGLYTGYGGHEHLIVNGVEYYAKEPNCEYEWAASSNGQTIDNAIKFTSSPDTFYVGRVTNFNSIQVGKVSLGLRVMFYGYDGKEHSVSSYEVLVCHKKFRTSHERNEALRSENSELESMQIELDQAHAKLAKVEIGLETCHSHQASTHFELNQARTKLTNKQTGLQTCHSHQEITQFELNQVRAKLAEERSGLATCHSDLNECRQKKIHQYNI